MNPPNAPLTHQIASDIERRGGWMPFERFMEMALYTPGLGYYSGGRRVLGQEPRDGSDFVTAPELTPRFGQALARQVAQALEATGTREVWEFGAGSGALAEQLLAALGDAIDRYTIVDLSGTLRQRQEARLRQALPHVFHKVVWVDSLPRALSGVVVGNEVLDAMPVGLMHFTGAAWEHRGVCLAAPAADAASTGPSFQWADRPAPAGERPATERNDAEFVPGTVTETHAQAEAFVATLAQRMVSGAAFFLDYGFPESEYFLPQRLGGTLMCHQGHQSDTDPLVQVGDKDITSHVNFSGVALAGQNAGWDVLGYTTQARFLLNLGLLEGMDAVAQDNTPAGFKDRAAVQMLVAEHEMGELFKVLGFVKGDWFDAQGFQSGDRTHTL